MNHLLFSLCIAVLWAGSGGPTSAQSKTAHSLTIEVTGITSNQGQVRIAVFSEEELWLHEPAFANSIEVTHDTLSWVIQNVPEGEYAIAAYHDENGNGKNDSNALGIPKEPYGFSNDARGRFGPAKWRKAKFQVTGMANKVSIKFK